MGCIDWFILGSIVVGALAFVVLLTALEHFICFLSRMWREHIRSVVEVPAFFRWAARTLPLMTVLAPRMRRHECDQEAVGEKTDVGDPALFVTDSLTISRDDDFARAA
jgi:hypothetical protein